MRRDSNPIFFGIVGFVLMIPLPLALFFLEDRQLPLSAYILCVCLGVGLLIGSTWLSVKNSIEHERRFRAGVPDESPPTEPILTLWGIPRDGLYNFLLKFEFFPRLLHLDPHGQELVSLFYSLWDANERSTTIDELWGHYKDPIGNLISRLIAGDELSHHEIGRLIHEITPKDVTRIEQSLPSTHPILDRLTKKYQVPTESGFSILL